MMKRVRPLLEVCCGSMTSVVNAVAGGADRIELCSALGVGGLTPSLGLLREVRRLYPELRIHVLIRPREGNFCYTEAELGVMTEDVRLALENGADGIVSGVLTPNGEIDTVRTRQIMSLCSGKPFTFHRAFDSVSNHLQSLEDLIQLGCDRVLTSGGATTADIGAAVLKKLCDSAKGRIIVMPGAGINASNVLKLVRITGCSEIHASCSRVMVALHRGPSLGATDNGACLETDVSEVADIISVLNKQ